MTKRKGREGRGGSGRRKRGAGGRSGRGKRKRSGGLRGRASTILMVVVLLAAGFLLGSFWLQWRRPRLAADPSASEVRETPVTLPEGFGDRVRVEVLNGSGEAGAAERAAARLRALGFDVVYFGNAASFGHPRTEVLARTPDPAAARRVADSLGLDSVVLRPDTSLYLDASVVLGSDWQAVLAARHPDGGRERPNLLERLLEKVRG